MITYRAHVKMTFVCFFENRFKNNSSVTYTDEREKCSFGNINGTRFYFWGGKTTDQSCCQASFGHESDGNFMYGIRAALNFSLSYD